MANGYCPALLAHIQDVAEGNAPGKKIHLAGFLKMLFCCQNSSVSPINQGNLDTGHYRGLTVKYRQRPTDVHVDDEDSCEVNRIPSYNEWNVPVLLFRKTSFFISDNEIAQYCEDASAKANLGGKAPSGFMKEHYELFVEHANILLKSVNTALVNLMATKFGKNIVTGSASPTTINIKPTGANLELDAGIIKLLADIRDNEICDEPCLVGGGLMANYDMARIAQCCSAAGVDASRFGIPQFMYDRTTQEQWGLNTFGVFAKGSVKLLSRNVYVGNFAGQKGNSVFFNVPFPVAEFNCVDMAECLNDLAIDIQMRYIDCPTEVDLNGQPTTVNRGWQVILSKRFNLWVQPTNAYSTGDPLDGSNGTLIYRVTNNA